MHIINAKIMVILSCLATVTYILWRYKFKRQRFSKLPTKWRQVGKIQKLIIYPLKSGGYLDLRKAKCGVRGLEEDSQSSKLSLCDRYVIYWTI